MSAPTAVSLHDVDVSFQVGGQSVHALAGVSLTIERGGSMAVVGRSGSGKSTLISVLALLRRPTRGSVYMADRDTSELTDAQLSTLRATQVGTVFQSFHLDPGFSAEDNVRLPWHFTSTQSGRASRVRARELLELLGIPELAQRQPGQMSGGQRQRVAIARALFMGPSLLIADEPTGNLDEGTASQIADVIFALPEAMGTAVVVVTHDTGIASRAGLQATISQGKLRLSGANSQRPLGDTDQGPDHTDPPGAESSGRRSTPGGVDGS
jgi:ABC-type lipoprotein export system ATPase subunit